MLFPGSRYATTELVEAPSSDGVLRRALATRRVPRTPGVLEHVILDGERLDHLSARFYGDPSKYWLILDANPEELDPLRLLRPGRRIRIPRDQAAPR
ncbi:tail protein X [Nonomuraea endophytica]|uniref:tail protein X n=1 Tax=Nonomuraea endophytica TaxID=714136 RepID=UPI0037CC37BC